MLRINGLISLTWSFAFFAISICCLWGIFVFWKVAALILILVLALSLAFFNILITAARDSFMSIKKNIWRIQIKSREWKENFSFPPYTPLVSAIVTWVFWVRREKYYTFVTCCFIVFWILLLIISNYTQICNKFWIPISKFNLYFAFLYFTH